MSKDHNLSITHAERDWSSCELMIGDVRYELRVYTGRDTIQVFLELDDYATDSQKDLGEIEVPYEILGEGGR